MKHNICLTQFALAIICSLSASISFGKIITTEFLNQANLGSDGPQIQELDIAGQRTYLLTFNSPGQKPSVRTISKKEYSKLQKQFRTIVKIAESPDEPGIPCAKELTYTKVDGENKISNTTVCYERLAADKKLQISDWFIELREKVL